MCSCAISGSLSLLIKRVMQNITTTYTFHWEQRRFIYSLNQTPSRRLLLREEIFKQEFLVEKSKDVQQVNPVSLPYQLNLQLEMAQALKNLWVCFTQWIFLKPDQHQEEKKEGLRVASWGWPWISQLLTIGWTGQSESVVPHGWMSQLQYLMLEAMCPPLRCVTDLEVITYMQMKQRNN